MKPIRLKDYSGILYLSLVMLVTVLLLILVQVLYQPEKPNLALEALRVEYAREDKPVVDHSSFQILQKKFDSPQEVTQACITCHTERHEEVMASSHWNWDRISYIEGRGVAAIGKKNVMNNFCIGVAGSEIACASCHTGFGLDDVKNFDFTKVENVDCLSCHADMGKYAKGKSMAGLPAYDIDLNEAAKSVGQPGIENCGTCHFYGGGGNNVKHGDLEEALYSATRDIDVHLAQNGIAMTCVDCHTAENHEIQGKLYSVSSANVNRALCTDCHTSTPHLSEMLNTHTARVACQTCHIPTYAKVNPTKMTWKWSDAGQLKDGAAFTIDDSTGAHTYMSIKGSFEWASNVKPEYVWFNGNADHYLMGDKIDPENGPLQVNRLLGSADDARSKIIPVKIHRGDQIYDRVHKTLIQPNLFADNPEDPAFWKDFDWGIAASFGMEAVGLPYSGEYDFIETEMYWPVNHMVSPASQSLQCADCHTRENGRLAALTDFYLPGRDRNQFLDGLGSWMIALAVFGVVIHSSMRILNFIRSEQDLEMKDYREFENGES